ncbi:MAG: anhydro-N-acetylmuramic acid kinase [Sinobacteraceae bacterium]|nr:anhydro-N-acetylmuramic acid kinase [Nevskiaceae bacterium]
MDEGAAPYLGLISGTSVDGIDAALVSFTADGPRLHGALTHPWPDELRERILAVAQGEGEIDLDAFGRLDVAIGQAFAQAALNLLAQAGMPAAAVRAIGSHGQTVRHRPCGPLPFTLQLGDAAVIAERTGLTVVADFRRADVAAGGQGAPLLPVLHAMLLARSGQTRAVVNLGGIANLTVLGADGQVYGFDTGPANGLLDAWCQRQCGQPFDRDGAFAAAGRVDAALLTALLADPYFALPPPKSTGREHFHLQWLLERYPGAAELDGTDVQATLLALSVESVAQAIERHAADAAEVLVCGGGVHNRTLFARLRERLAPRRLQSTAACGVDPDYLEAIAFAWLARQRVLGLPGNLPAVTGARGPRVLGALYAAPWRAQS